MTIAGEKMSKSLGNSLLVSRDRKRVARPLAVRYYLGAAHYRSTIEYHGGRCARPRPRSTGSRASCAGPCPGSTCPAPTSAPARALPAEFVEAMDDDLNVSGALAVIHETVRAGNTALDEGDDEVARDAALAVVDMTEVLGVNPLAAQWHAARAAGADDALSALDALVSASCQARAAARARPGLRHR